MYLVVKGYPVFNLFLRAYTNMYLFGTRLLSMFGNSCNLLLLMAMAVTYYY